MLSTRPAAATWSSGEHCRLQPKCLARLRAHTVGAVCLGIATSARGTTAWRLRAACASHCTSTTVSTRRFLPTSEPRFAKHSSYRTDHRNHDQQTRRLKTLCVGVWHKGPGDDCMPAENMLIENVTCARAHGLTIGTCLATRASTNRAPSVDPSSFGSFRARIDDTPPLVSLLRTDASRHRQQHERRHPEHHLPPRDGRALLIARLHPHLPQPRRRHLRRELLCSFASCRHLSQVKC